VSLSGVELILVRLPMVRPFRTSFGTQAVKEAIVVRAVGDDGVEGWGECAAAGDPLYSEEWNAGAWIVLRDYLVPAALANASPSIKGHPMARTALETALLDLRLRREGVSLASHLGGVRDRIECGVSLGIEDDLDDLLGQVDRFLSAGYRRIKLKIEPGKDLEPVRAVREAYPEASLSVDANAAYGPGDAEHLAGLDAFGLDYLEQPLPKDHLMAHADLQRLLETPICLDETLTSPHVTEEAIRLDACRVVNLKAGRVGGLGASRRVHDVAVGLGVPMWCGGMLETGVGRAVNVALAAMPGFTLPGDTSGSDRYFERDVTEPFVVDGDGTMAVPGGPGIGVTPLAEVLREVAEERHLVRL
jgi:O-succinylbenzoate synthase